MNTRFNISVLSFGFLLAAGLCLTSGCGHSQDSSNTNAATTAVGGKVSATPPPGFDVQKAQAAQQASQRASEDFRKYLEKKK